MSFHFHSPSRHRWECGRDVGPHGGVRMIQRGKQFGLTLKPGQPLFIPSELYRKGLDCDFTSELGVPCAPRLAHSTFAFAVTFGSACRGGRPLAARVSVGRWPGGCPVRISCPQVARDGHSDTLSCSLAEGGGQSISCLTSYRKSAHLRFGDIPGVGKLGPVKAQGSDTNDYSTDMTSPITSIGWLE